MRFPRRFHENAPAVLAARAQAPAEIAAPPKEVPTTTDMGHHLCCRMPVKGSPAGGTLEGGIMPKKTAGKAGDGPPNRPGTWKEVWPRYVIRNGKIIYPKGARCFHFWVRVA